MAAMFWEVTALDTHRDNSGGAPRFFATLDGPAGSFRVPVSADALLDYATFQREILLSSGIVYQFAVAEGRETAYANDCWRRFTGWLLNDAAARMAQAGAMAN
jgi:hypothetical protein